MIFMILLYGYKKRLFPLLVARTFCFYQLFELRCALCKYYVNSCQSSYDLVSCHTISRFVASSIMVYWYMHSISTNYFPLSPIKVSTAWLLRRTLARQTGMFALSQGFIRKFTIDSSTDFASFNTSYFPLLFIFLLILKPFRYTFQQILGKWHVPPLPKIYQYIYICI